MENVTTNEMLGLIGGLNTGDWIFVGVCLLGLFFVLEMLYATMKNLSAIAGTFAFSALKLAFIVTFLSLIFPTTQHVRNFVLNTFVEDKRLYLVYQLVANQTLGWITKIV
jgi:hypothetical protein